MFQILLGQTTQFTYIYILYIYIYTYNFDKSFHLHQTDAHQELQIFTASHSFSNVLEPCFASEVLEPCNENPWRNLISVCVLATSTFLALPSHHCITFFWLVKTCSISFSWQFHIVPALAPAENPQLVVHGHFQFLIFFEQWFNGDVMGI